MWVQRSMFLLVCCAGIICFTVCLTAKPHCFNCCYYGIHTMIGSLHFRLDRLWADHLRLDHLRLDRLTPNCLRPDRLRPNRLRPDHLRLDRLRPDHLRLDRLRPDHLRLNHHQYVFQILGFLIWVLVQSKSVELDSTKLNR